MLLHIGKSSFIPRCRRTSPIAPPRTIKNALFFLVSLIVTMTASSSDPSSSFANAQAAGTIVNKLSGLCPAVWQWNADTPGRISQFACNPEAKSQQWTFQPVLGNKFQIRAGHLPNMCLGILNGASKEGAPLVQQTCDSSNPEQMFAVQEISNKYYQLIPSSSTDKCVQVQKGPFRMRINQRFEQFPCNAADPSQSWDIQAELKRQFLPVEDGDRLRELVWAYDPSFASSKMAQMYGYPIGTWDVSKVTDFSDVFSFQSKFNEDISQWDTSRATTMEYMFKDASAFNGDLSLWNVSRVVSMYRMFAFARAFNEDLSMWNVSRVESMNGMFRSATVFNRDLSMWDVSRVESMNGMFEFARAFNGDLSIWNVSRVVSMNGMFSSARAFNGDLSMWNVSRVESMISMFHRATVFNRDLSMWNVSRLVSMNYMFHGATAFNGDLSLWNVSRVESMNSMFRGATVFNRDLSLWDVSGVERMDFMFHGATAFNGNISLWDVSGLESMNYMFDGAAAFNGDLSLWNVSGVPLKA